MKFRGMEPSELPADEISSDLDLEPAQLAFLSARSSSSLSVRKGTHKRMKLGILPEPPSSGSGLQSLPATLQPQPPLLKLRFINSPPPSIFTFSRIEAEDGSPLAIELVNTTTNTRVTLDSLSSSRLEIVPLNADITEENWTTKEFNQNILRPREGKRPLLVGDLTVTLKDGVGVISDLHKEVEGKGQDAVREDFILEVKPDIVQIADIKTSFLRSRLERKRVLIILDDVNDFRDVETFLGKLNYFGQEAE